MLGPCAAAAVVAADDGGAAGAVLEICLITWAVVRDWAEVSGHRTYVKNLFALSKSCEMMNGLVVTLGVC
jgi:hypothetical protein